MLKRSVIIGLVILVFGSLLLARVSEQPLGSGTKDDPYQIASLSNLSWVCNSEGSHDYFIQTADINAAGTISFLDSTGWPGIGDYYEPFIGYYDGQGFNIDSLYINRDESYTCTGLFGRVDSSRISNVHLRDCNISGRYYTGGLVGMVDNYSSVSGCSVNGTVSGKGLVGMLIGSGGESEIDRCRVSGTVEAEERAGGFIGDLYKGTITQSYSTADVNCDERAGGFAYYLSYSTIQNCFSTGDVNVSDNGAAGFVYEGKWLYANYCYSTGSVSDADGSPMGFEDVNFEVQYNYCFWDTQTSGTDQTGTSGIRAPIGKTTADMQDRSTFEEAGWSFNTRWDIDDSYPTLRQMDNLPVAQAPAAGDGTEADPYQISSLDNLYWITQDVGRWGMYYKQMCDIDASNTGAMPFGLTPIGDVNNKFTGSYNGQDFEISNLLIENIDAAYVGLFGWTDRATIKNLHLSDHKVLGSDYAGGLIGLAYGTEITDCSTNGISAASGIAGGLAGGLNLGSTLYKCSSSGKVLNAVFAVYVGGLAGSIANSSVSQCFSNASVSSITKAGGFSGSIWSSTVDNCYSMGDVVVSTDKAGGFAYYTQDAGFTNCYSAGEVTDPDIPGGFIDRDYDSTHVVACFWDSEASNADTSQGGTPRTTVEMKTQSTFTDSAWDFTSIWLMDTSINEGYPVFLWQIDPVLPDVAMLNVLDIDSTSAVIEYEIRELGLPRAIDYGICWSTDGSRDLNDNVISEGQADSTGIYTTMITGLNDSTEYSVFAYMISNIDTVYSKGLRFTTLETSISNLIPLEFALEQNYPNPFNPLTTITFAVPEAQYVKLQVFDLTGRLISTLVDEYKEAGYWDVKWNAFNVSSGLYIYRIESGEQCISRKMVLMK